MGGPEESTAGEGILDAIVSFILEKPQKITHQKRASLRSNQRLEIVVRGDTDPGTIFSVFRSPVMGSVKGR